MTARVYQFKRETQAVMRHPEQFEPAILADLSRATATDLTPGTAARLMAKSWLMQAALAWNTATPQDILHELATNVDWRVHFALLSNDRLCAEDIIASSRMCRLVADMSRAYILHVAYLQNQATPVEVLKWLYKEGMGVLRPTIIRHPNAVTLIPAWLKKSPGSTVHAVENLAADADLLDIIWKAQPTISNARNLVRRISSNDLHASTLIEIAKVNDAAKADLSNHFDTWAMVNEVTQVLKGTSRPAELLIYLAIKDRFVAQHLEAHPQVVQDWLATAHPSLVGFPLEWVQSALFSEEAVPA